MKIKERVIEVFKDKELYIFAIITVLFFGAFFLLQYAPDTYSVFTNTIRHTVKHFFSCGRYVSGVAAYFAIEILSFDNLGVYIASYILAIICTIASLYKLNKLIKKDLKNKSISIIISTLIVINPFSIELFMYIEKGIMMLSILLCIMAVEQIERFLKGNKKAILWTMIYMFIANCCYQGTVGIFVAISLIYIMKYSKNIKEFLLNNVWVAIAYGIPALINFLSIRFIFRNLRVNGKIILSDTVSKMLDGIYNMIIDTYKLLPEYIFLSVIIILLGFIIYKFVIQSKEKKKAIQLLGAFYLILGTLFSTIAPQLLQDTSAIWFVARSSYPMAAIIGLLAIYIFTNFETNKIEQKIISILLVVFLIIQLGYFMTYTIHNYIGNYIDKNISLQIKSAIEEYEQKTGIEIEKIAIYKDSMPQHAYPGLKASGDINVKAYSSEWCVNRILKLYTKRELEVIESDDTIKEEFEKKNWDYFNTEQIIFIDNVMHLCVF